jgi:Triosephosphate isomerase
MTWIGTSWKMNHDLPATKNYINSLIKNSKYLKNSKINFFVIPPHTSLMMFKNFKKKLPVMYGAQNMHWAEAGAYTGEISASMIKSCGCKIVELGHSERLKFFNENSNLINKKINLAIKHNLIPLICVGEKKLEKNLSRRKQVLKNQLDILFKKVINKKKLILIAYEPIWAIGKNNKAASIDYCNETMQYIRKIVSKKINKTKILYGGSVDEKNYKEFLKSDYIDGIFIGRAALNANNFIKICKER